jgi:hypothetical protein
MPKKPQLSTVRGESVEFPPDLAAKIASEPPEAQEHVRKGEFEELEAGKPMKEPVLFGVNSEAGPVIIEITAENLGLVGWKEAARRATLLAVNRRDFEIVPHFYDCGDSDEGEEMFTCEAYIGAGGGELLC